MFLIENAVEKPKMAPKTSHNFSLAQRMAESRLSLADALRCAMELAEALRRSHDAGHFHGAVTPANIMYSAAGVRLQPAPEASTGVSTPYTAPEILQGRAADDRSDIFSFGAILFEMLTGRRAFEGENAPIPSSGSPAVDRLLGLCLAQNPGARTPRMQKILMELKLLSVAARRAEAASAPVARREPGLDAAVVAGMVRTEMQQLESRITTKLEAHEKWVAEIQRSATQAMDSVKDQLLSLNAELAAAAGKFAQIEKGVDEIRTQNVQFERSVAADLVDIEQNMKANGTAIESARTAMSQTDDLVERVVEALESLQTAVLDQGDSYAERPAFAVN